MTGSEASCRRLTPEDIYEIALVNDARISPDGSLVAYVETRLSREKNNYQSSIWLVSTENPQPRRFTGADASDAMPRWSPDGTRLAFLSDRSGSKQIWTIPLTGGEATRLTDLSEPVTSFTWAPDGSTIAFVSKAEPPKSDEESKADADDTPSDKVRITRMPFRADGTPGFLDNKPTHLWCVSAAGGDPWQVTATEFDDSQPAWSPSGQELAFVSNRTEGREFNRVREIWVTHARGGEARSLLSGENASFNLPSWSPDGSLIAAAGHQEAAAGNARLADLWVVPAGGGEARDLTLGLDRDVDTGMAVDTSSSAEFELVWGPDGHSILFPVTDRGSVHLRRVALDSAESRLVVGGDRRLLNFSVSADGSRIAFAAAQPTNPGDIYVCDAEGANERRLTSVNADFFAGVEVSTPEPFEVPSQAEDRAPVHGWIMKPIGFLLGQKYPLVLEIHGGPHLMYGNAYFHEFQLLAAQGYVVVFTNPRGSQGYGQQWLAATRGAWGENDMPDQMAAVDYAVGLGFVDPNRLGVTGGSYGGYMTNWMIGHTDRFKAAVTQRCVSNLYSFVGTSDLGAVFGTYEANGMPWEDPEQYRRLSPITYVENIRTPLLIIHSERDYRCPIEQAEQLFVSLRMLGREVEFVRFPDESHGLSRSGQPKHRVERLNEILGWFQRYL